MVRGGEPHGCEGQQPAGTSCRAEQNNRKRRQPPAPSAEITEGFRHAHGPRLSLSGSARDFLSSLMQSNNGILSQLVASTASRLPPNVKYDAGQGARSRTQKIRIIHPNRPEAS
jgi:hypothetical protein